MWWLLANAEIVTLCGVFAFFGIICNAPFIYFVMAGGRLWIGAIFALICTALLTLIFFPVIFRHFGGPSISPEMYFRLICILGSVYVGFVFTMVLMALIPYEGLISFSLVKEEERRIPNLVNKVNDLDDESEDEVSPRRTYRIVIRKAGTPAKRDNTPLWEKVEGVKEKNTPETIIEGGHTWTPIEKK